MKITIEVPEMTCAKCDATAPIQPHLLSFKGTVPPQFREVLSAVLKERSDVVAMDDNGGSWAVMADDKPVGWAMGPAQSDLCAACATLWTEAGKAFLVPAPVATVEPELAPVDPELAEPEPVKSQPAAPKGPTLSEIIAARNYENNAPTTNSMMPMVSPFSPRR